MNFEDLPLRHPRDIYCQDACRAIRRTLNGMNFADADFSFAFIASDGPVSDEARSIRRVFETMANDRRLTSGERVLIIGTLLQDHSTRILRKEQGASVATTY